MLSILLLSSLAAAGHLTSTTTTTRPTGKPTIAPNCKVASYIPPPPEPPQSKVYKCKGPSGDFTSTFTRAYTWPPPRRTRPGVEDDSGVHTLLLTRAVVVEAEEEEEEEEEWSTAASGKLEGA
ncbi:hypothetical protein VM1G_09542 [Cytospora mali]|uniref:Uncharacterized protein n=1 Tax=Cytospora mali TaxID=578113 RepID=A0A194WC03_CYTMA|nr:hypothetical protein VM1G_09542 [Valsa mali]